MPAKIEPDENLWFLYICLQKSDMKAIDFAAVGDATDLKPPAARMRYTRLKQQIESGTLFGGNNTTSDRLLSPVQPGLEVKKRKLDYFDEASFDGDIYDMEEDTVRQGQARSARNVKIEGSGCMNLCLPPMNAGILNSTSTTSRPPALPSTIEQQSQIKTEPGSEPQPPIPPVRNTSNPEDSEDELPLAKIRKGMQSVSLSLPSSPAHTPRLQHPFGQYTSPPAIPNTIRSISNLRQQSKSAHFSSHLRTSVPALNLPKPKQPQQSQSHSQFAPQPRGRKPQYTHLHLPKPRPNHNLRPPILSPQASVSASPGQSNRSTPQSKSQHLKTHHQNQNQYQNRSQSKIQTPTSNQRKNQGKNQEAGKISRHFSRFLDPVGNQNRYYNNHSSAPNSKIPRAESERQNELEQARLENQIGTHIRNPAPRGQRFGRSDGQMGIYNPNRAVSPFHTFAQSSSNQNQYPPYTFPTHDSTMARGDRRDRMDASEAQKPQKGQGQWRRLDRGDRFGWVFRDES